MIEGCLVNEHGIRVIELAYRAEGPLERMRGLLGKSPLGEHEALWLEPCNSVHTFFMSYPLDVLFLDRDGLILKAVHNLYPWRLTCSLKARTTIELAAGQTQLLKIAKGDRLSWQDVT